MLIRPAAQADLDWITAHDHHISRDTLAHSLSRSQVWLAEEAGTILAWLRWNLFWDNTPFLNMLYVLDGYRDRGIGTALITHWEQSMQQAGYTTLLVSTASDEYAQHFYHKRGYLTIGGFLLPGEPYETILAKQV